MVEVGLIVLAVIGIGNLVLSIVFLLRNPNTTSNTNSTESLERLLRDELRGSRDEERKISGELRTELRDAMNEANKVLTNTITNSFGQQQQRLQDLTTQVMNLSKQNQEALDRVRQSLDLRVSEMRESNEKKLDEMKKTVDERLQETLEKRLGESFKLVSERLEAVHQGLGEMQNLASGVGDLKRVLTNVKTRGTWAEIQLGAILEQMLHQDQFARNVKVKPDSQEVVEFAIKLPGGREHSSDRTSETVWIPIDSKFPQEDYLRVVQAAENGNQAELQSATTALLRAVRSCAKDIQARYIAPPYSTDFAIMYLGTEGLYSEVLRQPGFAEELQNQYRVVIAGPTTLAAILNSLQMGFRTLAIEKRSAEVWRVLGAVKTEFGKFGEVLDKVKKQLETASRTIESTGVRTRAMEKTLKSVEAMPTDESEDILGIGNIDIN